MPTKVNQNQEKTTAQPETAASMALGPLWKLEGFDLQNNSLRNC